MPRAHVKKNEQVEVISGKDKGKRGRVLRVLPARSLVLVEGVNMIKRHTRPNPQRNIKGGIVEREGYIHVSNVLPVDPESDKPTRVGTKVLEDGSRIRVSRRGGAALEK